MRQQLTPPRPDLIELASQMRGQGASWHECLAATGISIHVLRCEIDAGYRERVAGMQKARHEAKRIAQGKRERPPSTSKPKAVKPPRERWVALSASGIRLGTGNAVPPASVLFERERAMLAPRTLTAALLGDPPAGRSALDKRNA